jgi:1-acyl-sn-glycerol-3-phosphate acyltransferase
VKYNEFGFFEKRTDTFYHDNVRDWNRWQLDYMKNTVQKAFEKRSEEPILKDHEATLLNGYKTQRIKRFKFGTVALYIDKIMLFSPGMKKDIIFLIDEVLGINVKRDEKTEFYYKEVCYRMSFKEKVSGYKWMKVVLMVKKKSKELGLAHNQKREELLKR